MSEIKYQLSQKLAEGLLYTAYRGTAQLPNGNQRDVVLKHIHPHLLQDGVLASHLAGFADVYRGLIHPSLAPIWTFGKVGENIFLVREFLPGISLQHLFSLVQRNEAALSPAMAIYLTQEISDAISSIHRYRVPGDKPIYLFHGGLAPENIILTKIGSVVVTDAGLDVIFWRNSDLAWRLRQRKQPYHPPEYSSGERPMRRGDGFGVAALLYQMVMGTTLHEACRLAGGVPFVAPSSQHTRITPDFDQLLYACLHPEIEQRLVQMKDIQQALRQPGLLRQQTMQRREAMAYLEVLVGESFPPQPITDGKMPINGAFVLEDLLPPRDDIPPPEERYRPPVYDSTESFHPTISPVEVFAPQEDTGNAELSIAAMEPLHESSGMGGKTAASPPPVAHMELESDEDESAGTDPLKLDHQPSTIEDPLEDTPPQGIPVPGRSEVLGTARLTAEDLAEELDDDDLDTDGQPKPADEESDETSKVSVSHTNDFDDDDEIGESTTLEPANLASLAPPPPGVSPKHPMQPTQLPPKPLASTTDDLASFVVEDDEEVDPGDITSLGPAEIEPPKPNDNVEVASADKILSDILDNSLDESLALGGQGLQDIFAQIEEETGQSIAPVSSKEAPDAPRTKVVFADETDEDVDDEGETAQRPRAQIVLQHAETRTGQAPHELLEEATPSQDELHSLSNESLLEAPSQDELVAEGTNVDDAPDGPESTQQGPAPNNQAVEGKEEEDLTGELEALSEDDAIELLEPDEEPESTAQTPASEIAAPPAPLGHTLQPIAGQPATPQPLHNSAPPPQPLPRTVALPSEQVLGGHPHGVMPPNGTPHMMAPAAHPPSAVALPRLPTGEALTPGMPETVALAMEQVTPSPSPAPAQAYVHNSNPPTPLAPGQERFGKFILLNRVALGGMAEVFRAKFEGPGGFQKVVAIKRILPEYSPDANFIQMFMDEARIAGSLRHPNIVQILELGAIENVFFISMEYIDGIDLARVIKIRRALQITIPLEIILDIGVAVCRALDYAHNECDPDGRPLQMIHRDVTPHNILISKKGECKLTDFGIAKASQNVAQTAVGELKGKISYMSPEQAEGTTLDARSDIFQVGIVLYEMLTLRKMFEGNSDQSILSKIQNAEFTPPRRVLSGVPKNIEQVVMKALATDKDDRYQSSAELQKALSQCRHQLKVKAPVDVADFAKEILVQRDELLAQHAAARRQQAQHGFNNAQAKPLGFNAPPPDSFQHETEPLWQRIPWRSNKVIISLIVICMLAAGGSLAALILSQKPKPKFVFLSVHTNPAAAAVLFDGTLVGKTPMFETKLPYDTKKHTLRIQRPGFKVFSLTFTFTQPNETKRVQVLLVKAKQTRRPKPRPIVPSQIRPLPIPTTPSPKKMKKTTP